MISETVISKGCRTVVVPAKFAHYPVLFIKMLGIPITRIGTKIQLEDASFINRFTLQLHELDDLVTAPNNDFQGRGE